MKDRLLGEGTIAKADVTQPSPASDDDVALVHTSEYLRKIKTDTLSAEEQMVLEVPFSPALREAAWLCAGGSTLAAWLALEKESSCIWVVGFTMRLPITRRGFA